MINDISQETSLTPNDANRWQNNVPYVLMHLLGTPKTCKKIQSTIMLSKKYSIIFEKIQQAYRNGINDVIIDPVWIWKNFRTQLRVNESP